ncbi:hypothetical protein GGX14DRAFT_392567 [Mycena pura]|uniref:Uncharacterized protein n=1 Tax=Mycena pura TaxID=153505 RepID=A0AAD6VRS2_9AGAR|nr:hypothetical protein GGX14DRAFT_392567 [Mycena pura]
MSAPLGRGHWCQGASAARAACGAGTIGHWAMDTARIADRGTRSAASGVGHVLILVDIDLDVSRGHWMYPEAISIVLWIYPWTCPEAIGCVQRLYPQDYGYIPGRVHRDGHGSGSGYKSVNPDPNPGNPDPCPRVNGSSTVPYIQFLFNSLLLFKFFAQCHTLVTQTRGFGSGNLPTRDPYPADPTRKPVGWTRTRVLPYVSSVYMDISRGRSQNVLYVSIELAIPRVPMVPETGTCTRPIRGKRVLVSAGGKPADAGVRVPVPTSAGWATRAKL